MKTIQHFFREHKTHLEREWYIPLIILLVGFASFGLGRLSLSEQSGLPVKVIPAAVENSAGNTEKNVAEGTVVVSRNGSKYHFPWCSGALRMKEENKIWFESIEAARAAGYSPAANCKGLE